MKQLLTFLLLALAFNFARAQDTFSIVAIDTITGELGSAGASCIGAPQIPQGCYILSDVIPGIGVIHTQASYHQSNQAYARSLMLQQVPPEEMIELLVANDVGGNPAVRQYGIADFYTGVPRTAAYTGANCLNYKNHIIGPNYVIAGNILLGQQILDSMEARFLATEGELACKLMAAMQGAKVVGADTRCLNAGISSLSAFLRVAKPNDLPNDLYLDLNIPSTIAGIDPIDSLQVLVDIWGGCELTYINEREKNHHIRVYPNPSDGMLNIEFPKKINEKVHVEILTITGSRLLEYRDVSESAIQIRYNFKPGMYICRILDDKGNEITEKFLIK
jgi:uncharacterized Ntn-hydrolase superfamily protein